MCITNNSSRLRHIVVLRAAAILLVVLGHATRNTATANPHLYSPAVTPFWEVLIQKYIYSFHMPLFFWISGYVFYYSALEQKEDFHILKQLFKKTKRLLVPLYVTSFLVLLPTIYLFGHPDGSFCQMVASFLVCQQIDHLWFLKDLFFIFIMMIPLSAFIKPVSIKGGLLFFLVVMLASYKRSLVPLFFQGALEYAPFFAAGYVTRKFEKLFCCYTPIALFLFFFISHALMSIWLLPDFPQPYPHNTFAWYGLALCGTYYMYYLSLIASQAGLPHKLWKCISLIDQRSYSIYLLHVSLLYMVLYFCFVCETTKALFRIVPSCLLGIIIPVLCHAVLSRIKGLSSMFSTP